MLPSYILRIVDKMHPVTKCTYCGNFLASPFVFAHWARIVYDYPDELLQKLPKSEVNIPYAKRTYDVFHMFIQIL